MKKRVLIVLSVLQFAFISKMFSQSVSINTTGNAADTSAMLDITSASKGILVPRMTQAQKLAIYTPADGLLVYQTDGTKGFYFYNAASGWTVLAQGSGGITSLNSLTDLTQTFATGTLGTAPNWISSGSVHTLNIPFASSPLVSAGLLSNTDWTTFNNKATATGTWSTTGNTGTNAATNFLGTTDNTSLLFRTQNIQRLLIDENGNIGIGTSPTFAATPNVEKLLVDAGTSANPTTSFNVISGKGYIDNYLQLNIQNRAATASASSDVVASNDAATETVNFVDLGINSSANTSTGVLGGVNKGYLYSTGSDFAIGNATVGRSLNFFTGGTASTNQRMLIDGSGNVGIGNSPTFTASPNIEKL